MGTTPLQKLRIQRENQTSSRRNDLIWMKFLSDWRNETSLDHSSQNQRRTCVPHHPYNWSHLNGTALRVKELYLLAHKMTSHKQWNWITIPLQTKYWTSDNKRIMSTSQNPMANIFSSAFSVKLNNSYYVTKTNKKALMSLQINVWLQIRILASSQFCSKTRALNHNADCLCSAYMKDPLNQL